MILQCNIEVKGVSPISKTQTNKSMTSLGKKADARAGINEGKKVRSLSLRKKLYIFT